MTDTQITRKRRSSLGGLLEGVKVALSDEKIMSEDRHVSIPSTEVGMERKDYGAHQKIVIKNIDPNRCRPWEYHNRDLHWLNKERCSDLIDSLNSNGQLEPAGVRKISGDPDFDYEIIYGVRRWFSCKFLNIALKARVLDKSDRECMILMHIENADSKDISDFERAFSFRQQLQSGVFKSQADLASAVHLTQAMISKYVTAASIYDFDFVPKLFADKTQISIRKANELFKLLTNQISLNAVRSKAMEILNNSTLEKEPTAKKFDMLLELSETPKDKSVKSNLAALNALEVVHSSIDSRGQLVIKVSPLSRKSKKDIVSAAVTETLNLYLGLD
jgi:ParB family chromosome partitioning protein